MVKASTRQEIENALALEAAIRSEIRNLSVNLHETVAEISGGGKGVVIPTLRQEGTKNRGPLPWIYHCEKRLNLRDSSQLYPR